MQLIRKIHYRFLLNDVVVVVVVVAGLFTGCFVTLFSVYGILAHLCGMFSPTTSYMETIYPVFRSLFSHVSLYCFIFFYCYCCFLSYCILCFKATNFVRP